MNVLEKILEEIDNLEKVYVDYRRDNFRDGFTSGTEKCCEIIRSHMDEANALEKKSVWEMDVIHHESYDLGRNIGWNECLEAIGQNENDSWIPYTLKNIPDKEDLYLVTCDDEEYPVKRMRFKKEDEYGLWYDDYGIYDGVILAWQSLPEPYKEK
ncbi:hypothetical protein [Mediterraneibacter gnavus]|uniref:hypothetical protein n=1 Tax=Mediterraneibacter gnavus TaxID=33038 RepID=UPI00232E83EC|nr:hypothetical protein [Mediterraneibacter gnavus]MDB8712088.1 hypothetical protein [Mediterraneibacter gnavus]MDB8715123.1 hypothetical protein [Mediterraneibacter gnavus]